MAEEKSNEASAKAPASKAAEKKPAKAKAKSRTAAGKAAEATSAGSSAAAQDKYVPRLKVRYLEEVKDQMREQFGYKNVMEIPKFEKIVVNMGVGEAATDSKAIEGAIRDLRTITGQQPMVTRARKSIAAFRLRAGMPIGAKVTLRADRMWEFLDRLMSVAIPRIRDFRGVSTKSFDGRGNFSMGVTEQLIFPEISYDSIDHTRGMDITFVTTAKTDEEAKALMGAFGFPFQK
ncbi:LSU ribosomal protein L5P [Coriobacterium glomerans PW2]|uniref:Large ribosomal subunit protein uL5 n=1 Tax=Coriobacterium glomerans (strain ATCC 49209 / DSM 20642 / JCM 10262 / PW2) TaxID=700015 RepID=F2N8N6_CORGP|nr:LSU ribosomal protein L5P [Coriobacterium glomerans PW2]